MDGQSNIPEVGCIITFGGYKWRVLDVQGDKALIITEDIVESRHYNDVPANITWETCTLREYLNTEFLDKLDSSRITEATNVNPDNKWFGTSGGNDTVDKVFLLSIGEVVKYFGDSGALELTPRPLLQRILIRLGLKGGSIYEDTSMIDDQFGLAREATNHDPGVENEHERHVWYMRSIGCEEGFVTYVSKGGVIWASGIRAGAGCFAPGGVRPALWLKL